MENNNNNQTRITGDVLEKIRKGEVKMHSRVYFWLKMLILIGVIFLTILTSSLVISYVLFSVRVSGQQFLLGYGWRGIETFIVLFPWRMLILDILFIVILEALITRFRFGYRNSLISLLLGIFLFTLFIAFLIIVTPIHMILLRRAEHRQLPVIGSMYIHLRKSPQEQGIFQGKVISIAGDYFVVEHQDADDPKPVDVTVIAPSELHVSQFLHLGDAVFVAGTLQKDGIHAYGISRVDQGTE